MSALSAAAQDEDGDIIKTLQARVADLEAQLYAFGAGGVGSTVARQDHHEQHLNMVPEGWKLVAWQPIETAPKGRIVLVHYKNRLGNGRTMRARYYPEDTLESDTTESGWADEGWYEESEAYEYMMPLDGDPTHWMPLPPPPGSIQV